MNNNLKINRLLRHDFLGFFINAIVVFLIFTQSSLAVEQPRALATDGRIKVVAYQENNVVPVKASTFTTTQIVFGHNEVIENIQNGDLDAWTVSVQKGLPNMLFLKPTIVDSKTNMTIVTNRHTYYFQLDSGASLSKLPSDSTYAIHFIYPRQARRTLLANVRYNQAQKRAILNAHKNPQSYHWNYSFSGAHSIMPLHIFDDGRFTYMQLQLGQPVPAIFAVDNASGKESVVNYRRRGQYIIVQQVAPQFTLRAGKYHVASIFNNRLIHQLSARRKG
jgi:type IV secretion system protein VirB9